MAKNGSDLYNVFSKLDFLIHFIIEKYFCFSLLIKITDDS